MYINKGQKHIYSKWYASARKNRTVKANIIIIMSKTIALIQNNMYLHVPCFLVHRKDTQIPLEFSMKHVLLNILPTFFFMMNISPKL